MKRGSRRTEDEVVVMVSHWGTRGGGPQIQAYLTEALVASGRVRIAACYDRSSEVAERMRKLTIPLLEVGALRGGKVRRSLLVAFDTLRFFALCRKLHVSHVLEPMGHPFQLPGRILLRACGVYAITSIHDATRHLGEESRLLDAIAALSARQSDAVLAFSESVAELLRRQSNISAPVLSGFHPPFGEVARSSPRSLSEKEPVIGFFGRVEQYKGLHRLLRASSLLPFSHSVKIVGSGELSDEEKRLVAESQHVIDVELRWIETGEVPSLLDTFDVVALPYDEASQSGVIPLAAARGIPVVCTPVGALPEQLESGGVVANGMAPEEFALALQEALEAHEYSRLSSEALRVAGQRTWAGLADLLVIHVMGEDGQGRRD